MIDCFGFPKTSISLPLLFCWGYFRRASLGVQLNLCVRLEVDEFTPGEAEVSLSVSTFPRRTTSLFLTALSSFKKDSVLLGVVAILYYTDAA